VQGIIRGVSASPQSNPSDTITQPTAASGRRQPRQVSIGRVTLAPRGVFFHPTALSSDIDNNGNFDVTNVPSGLYMLFGRVGVSTVLMPVEVSGTDLNLDIVLSSGLSVSGQIKLDDMPPGLSNVMRSMQVS